MLWQAGHKSCGLSSELTLDGPAGVELETRSACGWGAVDVVSKASNFLASFPNAGFWFAIWGDNMAA